MHITVNAGSRTPIYKQIVNQIKDMIIRTELVDGARLPSERILADSIGVHRNTVIRAYGELKAEGFIDAVRGVGYRVVSREAEVADIPQSQLLYWPAIIKEEMWEVNPQFDYFFTKMYEIPEGISFAGGIISPEAYPRDAMVEVLNDIVEREDIYSYVPFQGRGDLRHCLSKFLRSKSIYANSSEIAIVSDTHQALECLIEMLIEPGDVVLMEEPNYPNVYRQFKMAGANIITVPGDSEGMMTTLMEPIIQKYHPKLVLASGGFQDPTGMAMSLERKRILLDLSHKYHFPIVEDDWASELCYTENSIPSMKAMDPGNHVIYIYSFALTFAPGVRVALVSGAKDLIDRFNNLLSMKFINADNLSQAMLCRYMEKGIYQKVLKDVCKLYQEKRDLMCDKLEEAREMGVSFERPQGGIYVWCRLPDNMNLSKLIKMSAKQGLAFIPGDVFFLNGTKGEQHIRLNFSYAKKEQIGEGMNSLLQMMGECIEF